MLGDLDAMDIAMTCATVGILSGIFGGLFFIKLGTKKGWTKYMKGFNQISDDLRCGLVPKNERKSMGEGNYFIHVLDPLAWQSGSDADRIPVSVWDSVRESMQRSVWICRIT